MKDKNIQNYVWLYPYIDPSPVELHKGDLIKTRKGVLLRVNYQSISGWAVSPLDKDLSSFNIPNALITQYPKVSPIRSFVVNLLTKYRP